MGLFNLFGKGTRKVPGRLADATQATAKVLEVGDCQSTLQDDLKIALRLQVDPPFGPSYETIAIWHVEPAHVQDVQPGQSIAIKIDKQNPKIIFPDESVSWAAQKDVRECGEADLKGLSRSLDKGTRARFNQATPATAEIVEVGNSYNERNYGVSVALRMQVNPPAGLPYQVISIWEVEPTHIQDVQVGKTVAIRIDSKNPKVVFPADRWALQVYLDEYTEEDMQN